jgi:hypothetical protein
VSSEFLQFFLFFSGGGFFATEGTEDSEGKEISKAGILAGNWRCLGRVEEIRRSGDPGIRRWRSEDQEIRKCSIFWVDR